MAGITPLVPPRTGAVNGKLEIKTDTFLTLDELLKHRPQFEPFLDEITQKGWRYFYIEGFGTVIKEMNVSAPYKFIVSEHPRGGLTYTMTMDFGRAIPDAKLKEVISLDRFIINIASKRYPRAMTIDLTRSEVTYVNESLWVSSEEGYTEEAKGALNILRWLIEEKKFSLKVEKGAKLWELIANIGKK